MKEVDILLQKTAHDPHINQTRQAQGQIPVCTLDDRRMANPAIFGLLTRYGQMATQMKPLIGSTGSLWLKGETEGKPAGVFASTASFACADTAAAQSDDSCPGKWEQIAPTETLLELRCLHRTPRRK